MERHPRPSSDRHAHTDPRGRHDMRMLAGTLRIKEGATVRGLTRSNDQTPYSIRLPTTRRQSRQSHSLYLRHSTRPTTNLCSRALDVNIRRDSMKRSDVIRTPHKERSLPFPSTPLPCLGERRSRVSVTTPLGFDLRPQPSTIFETRLSDSNDDTQRLVRGMRGIRGTDVVVDREPRELRIVVYSVVSTRP